MFGSTGEQKLLESLKNFAAQSENNITLKRGWLGLNLLNVRYDPSKMLFTVTRKIMEQIILIKDLNSSNPWIPEKKQSVDLIPNHIKNTDFLSILCGQPPR